MSPTPQHRSGDPDPDETRPVGVPPHQPAPADSGVDAAQEASEESFPSSDPPAAGTPSAGTGDGER